MLGPNRVEMTGRVDRLLGGKTRRGGYWLLISVEVTEDDERSSTYPVWWFGEESDYDIYKGVAEGDEIEVVGELRWGRNRDDEWELRVIALSFGVTSSDARGKRGRERNGREERRERNGREERRERNGDRRERKKAEDEEPPF